MASDLVGGAKVKVYAKNRFSILIIIMNWLSVAIRK